MAKKHLNVFLTLLFLTVFLVNFGVSAPAEARESPLDIYLVEMEGTITQGKSSFLDRQISAIDAEEVQAMVILLDTPGGLVDATLDLAKSFGESPVPIIVFVTPSGAIAASAGAFILVSSDIAAMSPGTSVGAAMPVAISPAGTGEADEKTTSFLAGHMESLAEEKGRPPDVARRFVTENLTLSAREAEEKGIADLVAPNFPALLESLDGWEGVKNEQPYTLQTEGAAVVEQEMDLRERFQDGVSDPQLAFMLLMAGAMGLYVGFGMPGTFVPEVLGGIALVLGIYGLGMFDTNTAGIILLVLGFGLLAAELFTGGFGVLGVGGAASIVLGAILLPSEPLMAPDWYSSFLATAIGVGAAVGIVAFIIVYMFASTWRRRKEGADFFRPAEKVVVTQDLNPEGTVKMRGEIWRAKSSDGSEIPKGSQAEVVDQEGLLLIVQRPGGKEDQPGSDK